MWINNIKLQNYLEYNGCTPVYETDTEVYYTKDKELKTLLTRYFIQSKCIPNKLSW